MTRRGSSLSAVPKGILPPRPAPEIKSARDLMARDLPPVRWVVPGLLPEGVSLLAGKSKIRKSWLALGLCVSVASGGVALGKIGVEQGDALYLALEDNERRIQSRLRKVLDGAECPAGFDYATEFPRIDQDAEIHVRAWLEAHPNARLVVIDTLAKIRSRTSSSNSGYQEDYEALESLLPLAAEFQVAIVVVHHTRKAAATDVVDEINATTGLMGGVDGFMILKAERGKGEATIFVTGREIEEEGELALVWDPVLHSWVIVGDAEEMRMSEERRLLLDILRRADRPLQTAEIVEQLGKSRQAAHKLLAALETDGRIERMGRGQWTLATFTNEDCQPPPQGGLQRGLQETPHGNAENSPLSTLSTMSTPFEHENNARGGLQGLQGLQEPQTPHGNAENSAAVCQPPDDGGVYKVDKATSLPPPGDWRSHPLECPCDECVFGG